LVLSLEVVVGHLPNHDLVFSEFAKQLIHAGDLNWLS